MTRRIVPIVGLVCLVAASTGCAAWAQTSGPETFRGHFGFEPPPVSRAGVCAGAVGALPGFTVTPSAPGAHMVRVSLPFAPAALPVSMGLRVRCGEAECAADVRVLTCHPGQPVSVRRALVTFPFTFETVSPHEFMPALDGEHPPCPPFKGGDPEGEVGIEFGGSVVTVGKDGVTLALPDGIRWHAAPIAPALAPALAPDALLEIEVVEQGMYYLWVRALIDDPRWPRIVEVQLDSLGTVAVQLHVQRIEEGDAMAPDLGWTVEGPGLDPLPPHAFADGSPCEIATADGNAVLSFPDAHRNRRGHVSVDNGVARYLRCTADEGVPFQEAAWRRAAFVLGKLGHTPRNALLEPRLDVTVAPSAFDPLYDTDESMDLSLWPDLDDLRRYTDTAIVQSMLDGDDFGNVTAFSHGGPASVYGMNRLNHGPAIFEEAWRAGNAALRDTAVLWCGNMHDLSVWWGGKDFGGTRYNNALAAGEKAHEGDPAFMWRTNWSSHFCTKGFDAFFYAYEETGDPRMLAALRAQTAYAKTYIHTDTGECRNIGDVADFMTMWRCTGVEEYRDHALRLFRELRTKLSTGDLFSQGGQPIVDDVPFMDDDSIGYKHPFAKPYIIGYALSGLPELLAGTDEPKLRDVVRAVADFLAGSEDLAGGWRYPHPKSSAVIVSQGIEHAAQLCRAAEALEARGESIGGLLDAIERVLQARVLAFRRTGTILSGLQGWERSTGALPEGKTLYDLYQMPEDRDVSRDYTEGTVGIGSAPPEGLVYFSEVLDFYLAHRPAERLFNATPELASVLGRTPDARIRLIPQEAGSYLRMERPEDPNIGFTLWAPEWASFPPLDYSPEQLGGMAIDWKRDEQTGAVWYTLDRPEATFTACFTPHIEYVECAYTVWPKPGVDVPPTLGIGPCQQMKNGIFEGEETELLERLWFQSNGTWVTLASGANGNARNVCYIQGNPSPEMTGGMAENNWRTVQSPRPDNALIACTSRDGAWVAAAASEFSTSVCNNSAASHRCIHSQGSMPLRKDGPTTLRVNAYLMRGTLDGLARRYARDVARWKAIPASPASGEGRTDAYGMRAMLPAFHERRVARMDFPWSWPVEGLDFSEWRAQARALYVETLSVPPPRAPFEPRVLAVEDRGSYEARKLAFNLSTDNRVLAYLLVPKGAGPFPAILALHDHGAHFSIGKEKVVRPFGVPDAVLQDAGEWVKTCYGGRYIGDELAQRGYVVFATDALFWGDRGRFEGVEYEAQQALAANVLQLGQSWAGMIVWDDIRSAEFLQGLPEVAPDRIGCVGLSMGSNRSWHLAAATDIVQAGIAICWMGDTPTLAAEGNNQTKGYSAFSMIHPGLRNALDYADVASIACPKPMLFYNGEQDGLFPVAGVEAAYKTLHEAWASQNAEDRLETRLWPVPHEFNAEMQQAAFDWIDRFLK